MSAAMTPSPPLEHLEEPRTIDDVLRAIDRILDWSINAQSNIGYFATLYKRVTVAIRDAIDDGVFDDGRRMEQLDVAFAHRYFSALNAYFHPNEYQRPTLPWEVAFVGDQNDQAIILQHMMTGLNAHITFDLGLAVLAVAANALDKLENDFNRVNALLCSQIPGILGVVEQLSPEFRVIRRVLPNAVEVALLKRMITKLRRSAWYFAIYMDLHPESARERRVNQASWTAAMGAWYLQPPARLTPFPILVRAIAKRENRDVAANLRALEQIRNTPEKLDKSYL